MTDSTEVAAVRAITVPFHGAELFVVEHNGQPYTPMKPIVEDMGLAWQPQHRKVTANKSRWGMVEITIPSEELNHHDGDAGLNGRDDHPGQRRSMTMLPLRKLPGWLATIDPGRVKNPDVRARVIQYQNECDEVLWQYWNDGVAVNPRALYSVNPGDVLSKDEAETLRLMLKAAVDRLPKHLQGKKMLQGWSKLKAHFKVSYREIPRHEFSEAVSIVARHTAEWEVVDEPQGETLNDEIDRLIQQIETPNGVATHLFVPLVNAVLRKQGLDLSVSIKGDSAHLSPGQSKEVTERLDRLGQIFNPESRQYADVLGIRRALCGLDPKLGMREEGYRPVLPAL